ncbi:hypothetical protein M0802_009539 [Mischocyttarus mexicanus]|nr:hypothetical protein M0802_009539 [Mischocyttarus mexicanus]
MDGKVCALSSNEARLLLVGGGGSGEFWSKLRHIFLTNQIMQMNSWKIQNLLNAIHEKVQGEGKKRKRGLHCVDENGKKWEAMDATLITNQIKIKNTCQSKFAMKALFVEMCLAYLTQPDLIRVVSEFQSS